MEIINALGRRKSAVARVFVNAGKGNITVNGKSVKEYFCDDTLVFIVNQPLMLTNTQAEFDIQANLDGGGLGIARALCKIDSEAYRHILKTNGLLTRDARVVERKKPGQPGARRRFQFSKR